MTKRHIQNELTHRHITFAEYIMSLDKLDFEYSYDGRWTAGQQLVHILKSTKPVLMALRLPPILLRLLFGLSLRRSSTYANLVSRYKGALANGGKAARQFQPGTVSYGQAEQLKNELLLIITKINLRVEKFSEDALEDYRLPHPLLGPLTLREMLYFTMYHVEHHMEKTRQNLRYLSTPAE